MTLWMWFAGGAQALLAGFRSQLVMGSRMPNYKDFYHKLWPEARVLDVGCGLGEISAEISRRVPSGYVLGVDKSLSVLVQAIQNYPRANYSNLRFLQADALELKLDEDTFDFVVSRGCLHYLEHPGHAFASFAAHLQSDGFLHAWCLGQGNALKINSTLQRLIQRPQWLEHFRGFSQTGSLATPDSCASWLESAGLTQNTVALVKQRLHFPNRGSFVHWLSYNWEHFQRIPVLQYCTFVDEFLLALGPSIAGPYRADLVWLSINAIKS